jgi:hypothetical protein
MAAAAAAAGTACDGKHGLVDCAFVKTDTDMIDFGVIKTPKKGRSDCRNVDMRECVLRNDWGCFVNSASDGVLVESKGTAQFNRRLLNFGWSASERDYVVSRDEELSTEKYHRGKKYFMGVKSFISPLELLRKIVSFFEGNLRHTQYFFQVERTSRSSGHAVLACVERSVEPNAKLKLSILNNNDCGEPTLVRCLKRHFNRSVGFESEIAFSGLMLNTLKDMAATKIVQIEEDNGIEYVDRYGYCLTWTALLPYLMMKLEFDDFATFSNALRTVSGSDKDRCARRLFAIRAFYEDFCSDAKDRVENRVTYVTVYDSAREVGVLERVAAPNTTARPKTLEEATAIARKIVRGLEDVNFHAPIGYDAMCEEMTSRYEKWWKSTEPGNRGGLPLKPTEEWEFWKDGAEPRKRAAAWQIFLFDPAAQGIHMNHLTSGDAGVRLRAMVHLTIAVSTMTNTPIKTARELGMCLFGGDMPYKRTLLTTGGTGRGMTAWLGMYGDPRISMDAVDPEKGDPEDRKDVLKYVTSTTAFDAFDVEDYDARVTEFRAYAKGAGAVFYLSDMPNDVNAISSKLEALKKLGKSRIALDRHAAAPLGYKTKQEFKDARSSLNKLAEEMKRDGAMPGCAGDSGVFVYGRPSVGGKVGPLVVGYDAKCKKGNGGYIDPTVPPVPAKSTLTATSRSLKERNQGRARGMTPFKRSQQDARSRPALKRALAETLVKRIT